MALNLLFLILDDGLFIGVDKDLSCVSVNDKQGTVLYLRGYGFQAEEEAIFISGSKKSGGFGLTNRELLAGSSIPTVENRILGYGRFTINREVRIPENIPVNPGDRLLTVFGSGLALGFISKGPIYAEAIKHPELIEFKKERK